MVEVKETGTMGMVPPDFYFWITEGIKDPKTGKIVDKKSIYYQKGEFYEGEDLPPIRWQDVPEFFWNTVRKSYSPEVILREKLIFPEERKLTPEEHDEKMEKKGEELWVCEEEGCGETMPNKDRAVHMMTHARKKKKIERDAEKAQLAQV